ncbi:hypothetical protein AB0L63_30760 [Nocardia sp. NPDC051990]|uniref:hypothetical protein n=1 Tax=Nocardia sp. NPDC051990 TaxID=3155285 RepID=UPI00342DAD6A
MTHAHIGRRATGLEARIRDIEEGYGEAQLGLTRRVSGLEIWAGRVTTHANGVGRNVKLIAEHLGIPPVDTPEISMPTEAEIDAVLDEDC